jgi:hypothetical protein
MGETAEIAGGPYVLDYVSGVVTLRKDDGVGVRVINDSGVNENARVVCYHNTGAGASVHVDSGRATVTPTWVWFAGFTVRNDGDYYIRIQVTSDALVPSASFERSAALGFPPVVHYTPGDFAVFDLTRRRLD